MPSDLDLTLSPLYHLNGQEMPSLPGLLAVSPPRRAARGREGDRLMVYLLLTGNTVFSTAEYLQITSQMAAQFYQTRGSLTAALRTIAEALNRILLERNLGTTGRGQYTIGWLVLGALRGSQLFLLMCGPTHVFWLGKDETRHIHDPALSGRGLGLGQTTKLYYAQVDLQPGDRLLFCGQLPPAWEQALLHERGQASLEATRRRLIVQAEGDLNAVLIQALAGSGKVTVLRPTEQPSAYAIPPRSEAQIPPPAQTAPPTERTFPPSIPRAAPRQTDLASEEGPPAFERVRPVASRPGMPRRTSERTRQAARALAGGIQAWRRIIEKVSTGVRSLLPRLLPGVQPKAPLALPNSVVIFIAIAVPLVVVTIASMIYFRNGWAAQYQTYFAQAQAAAVQAVGETDAVKLREAWQATLYWLEKAEVYQETAESRALRQQAQNGLDALDGIIRLDFQPALSGGLARTDQIVRMAANETDLYLLTAVQGNVLHAFLTGSGYQLDSAFNCNPGAYGGYQVGALVDIRVLPKVNALNAAVLGIDATGNLLYCAPDQAPQAVPLAPPDINWGQVTAFTLDAGNLYVLDGPARAVWVYGGQDGAFLERPTFFFAQQVPPLEDVIDLAVNGDDLYLLHADGHLTTCTYSRLDAVPTRCNDPAVLTNPYAGGGGDFAKTHFTQVLFTAPPDSAILLLESNSQAVYRFSPRSLELSGQLRAFSGKDNPLPAGPLTAVTASPSHVLFLALGNQVYFATAVP